MVSNPTHSQEPQPEASAPKATVGFRELPEVLIFMINVMKVLYARLRWGRLISFLKSDAAMESFANYSNSQTFGNSWIIENRSECENFMRSVWNPNRTLAIAVQERRYFAPTRLACRFLTNFNEQRWRIPTVAINLTALYNPIMSQNNCPVVPCPPKTKKGAVAFIS